MGTGISVFVARHPLPSSPFFSDMSDDRLWLMKDKVPAAGPGPIARHNRLFQGQKRTRGSKWLRETTRWPVFGILGVRRCNWEKGWPEAIQRQQLEGQCSSTCSCRVPTNTQRDSYVLYPAQVCSIIQPSESKASSTLVVQCIFAVLRTNELTAVVTDFLTTTSLPCTVEIKDRYSKASRWKNIFCQLTFVFKGKGKWYLYSYTQFQL